MGSHRRPSTARVVVGVAGGASEDRPPTLSVQLDMVLPDNRVAAVAFIKRGAGLDPSRPLSGQLHLLNIGDGSPSELLHAYIHNAVSPFFNAYASKISARSGASDREAKTGADLDACTE